MKARIINTPVEVEVIPYFPEGMFAGFTDVSGRLQPGMVVYKTSDLEFIDKPEPLKPTVDWAAFRREAAKVAMQGILASGDDGWSLTLAEGYKPEEKHSYPIGIARFAIACADELIKQLKEED